MDDQLLKFGLTAFTTLLVVVDPFGILPIFLALAKGRPLEQRSRMVRRAVVLGFGIAMLFLIAGHEALTYLGVTVHAFSISGGVLLFATALPMLFGHRPGLQSAGEVEGDQADPAIFPLAIPLLAGPGTITTILLLAAQSRDSIPRLLVVALSLAVVFFLTWIILGFATQHVLRRLGPGGLHVATRVLGILLAALAVQFVLNGITDYVRLLQTPANSAFWHDHWHPAAGAASHACHSFGTRYFEHMPERTQKPPAPSPWGPKEGDSGGPKAPDVSKPDVKDLLQRMRRVDPNQSRRYRQRTGQ